MSKIINERDVLSAQVVELHEVAQLSRDAACELIPAEVPERKSMSE